MSNAYKCDKCGDVFEGEPAGLFVLAVNDPGTIYPLEGKEADEMCLDCFGEVERYVTGGYE